MTTPLTASGLHALRELLSDHLGIEWDVLTVGVYGYLQVSRANGEQSAIVQIDRYRVIHDLQGMARSGRPMVAGQYDGTGWRGEMLRHVSALVGAANRGYQLCVRCRRARGPVVRWVDWWCDDCDRRRR